MNAYFRSFAAGEVAPALYGRVDLTKYQTGVRTLRNFLVARHGGAYNRPGSSTVTETKDSARQTRLIPFIINRNQAYVLEFGHEYMRPIRNDSYIDVPAVEITAIQKVSAAIVHTAKFHGFKVGDQVRFSGITTGMVELNGRVGTVTAVTLDEAESSFTVNIDVTGFTTYTSGGSVDLLYPRIVEFETPYTEDVLRELTFSHTTTTINSALGAMKISHQSALPQMITYFNDYAWTLEDMEFSPSIRAVTAVTHTPNATGTVTAWQVTAVRHFPFEESLPTLGTSASTPTSGSPITLNWTAVPRAREYYVYKYQNGAFGFIGATTNTFFVDNGYTGTSIDLSDNPPEASTPFYIPTFGPRITPATVGFFQQREFYGNLGPANDTGGLIPFATSSWDPRPDGVLSSRIGVPNNFTLNRPTQDDDSISFRILGEQRAEIRHFLDIGKLAIFTTTGEWIAEGDGSGKLTPTAVNLKQYSDHGISLLRPLRVNGGAVFIQGTGSIWRSFGFDFSVDGYRGNDLTTFSPHLVDGYEFVDWAYQKSPHSIIWAVRDDGALIGLTLVQEQQVIGFHRHDLNNGVVENVCVIPNGNEDVVYLVVKREIEGEEKRFIERLNSRQVTSDIRDSVFVDAAATYDGRNTNEEHTMTLSGGVTWEQGEVLTLTSSEDFFDGFDVNTKIHLRDADDSLVRLTIESVTDTQTASVVADRDIGAGFQDTALSNWGHALRIMEGMEHLEGREVAVIGDGFVIANPNNPDVTTEIVVADGEIELPDCFVVIHAGEPITADLETLNIEAVDGSLLAKGKLTNEVVILHESSRGFWAGAVAPDEDAEDPTSGLFNKLRETRFRYEEGYDDPIALRTGTTKLGIESRWNTHGRVFIRHIDPTPLGILAIAPAGFISLGG